MNPVIGLLLLLVVLLLFEVWLRNQREPGMTIQVAKKGDVAAQKRLFEMYFKGENTRQNYDKAVWWLERAAERGDVPAQMFLADIFFAGRGLNSDAKGKYKNIRKALQWYKKAAEAGDARGARCYADHYYNGQGVDKSYDTALVWYNKAIERGDVLARFRLGNMYEHGHGVMQNNVAAYMWYSLAYNSAEDYGSMQKVMAEHVNAMRQRISNMEMVRAEENAAKWLGEFYENLKVG